MPITSVLNGKQKPHTPRILARPTAIATKNDFTITVANRVTSPIGHFGAASKHEVIKLADKRTTKSPISASRSKIDLNTSGVSRKPSSRSPFAKQAVIEGESKKTSKKSDEITD